MTTRELVVLLNDRRIGVVRQGARAAFEFIYDDAWLGEAGAIAISLLRADY